MLDHDHLTYSVKKPIRDKQASEHALISIDRSQKLDLLIHLLTNLHKSLVVCGPQGIGKSTLLKTLQDSCKGIWPICLLQGSERLSFEAIATQLDASLIPGSADDRFDLSRLKAYCSKHKAVLIVDNAGTLVPGLIGELLRFADSLAGLRLVLAMRHDEFDAKTATEPSLDACHVIELPPLNHRQCLTYLQNLSAQGQYALSYADVTDELVEKLLNKTHGIPGRIVAELPKMRRLQKQRKGKMLLIAGLSMALAALGYQWRGQFIRDANKPVSPQTAQQAALPITANQSLSPPPLPGDRPEAIPVPAATIALDPLPVPAVVKPQITDATPDNPPAAASEQPPTPTAIEPTSAIDAALPTSNQQTATPPVTPAPIKPAAAKTGTDKSKPEKPAEPKSVEAESSSQVPGSAESAEIGDVAWIHEQPGDFYTVQIMVLSSRNAVDRFLRKYANYANDLKYYPIGKAGQEKYVLLYGAFATAGEAMTAKAEMPAEFGAGVIKRMKAIQKDSRRK
ncbi:MULTISPECIES: SPOR domain-containing protein [Methylomonas]|uniref:SPOR domain-containing protein n=1 Tax=Methylomonas TaxID=416 RepID=UPI0012323513|nr:AAA family ATPase [Methylomonas rhizoryzae]